MDRARRGLPGQTPLSKKHRPPSRVAPFVIDCSDTRYHVVRAAAARAGWGVDDGERAQPVPAVFHGVDIVAHTVRAGAGAAAARPGCQGPTEAATGGAGTSGGCAEPLHRPQVLWVDRSVLPSRVSALRSYQRLNHFPGMNIIARKALLFKRLMRIRKACGGGGGSSQPPEASSLQGILDVLYPRSFSSLSGMAALTRHMEKEASASDFYIVKPNTGCQGRGIRLTRDPPSVLRPEETIEKAAECLIQCYVDRPLLIEGRKFDLRLYVLLTQVTPVSTAATRAMTAVTRAGDEVASVPAALRGIHLYIHEEGLVRMCVAPYEPPTEANCGKGSAHLTNYSVNKKEADYIVHGAPAAAGPASDTSVSTSVADSGYKRDMHFLQRFVNGLPQAAATMTTTDLWRTVKRQIDECVVLTILSGVSGLQRELSGARGTPRSCFELLGFDIMLRADTLAPVLMEVNHSPSLFCETDLDFHVKERVLRDLLAVVASYTPSQHQLPRGPGVGARVERGCLDREGGEEERALVSSGAVRFTELLPHYVAAPDTFDGSAGVHDWTAPERRRQLDMISLGGAIL